MYALFMDLKAAFHSVDKERLWTCLREKGLNEELVRKNRKYTRKQKM